MDRLVALILGGGQGKRLFPLTMYRSKPAVPIGGKYRLIDIPVSNCLHSNIKDIYVVTQFNSESLNNHINNTYRFDFFSRAFVRILAAEQTLRNVNWFQGTADAVRKNISHLDLSDNDDILVLSGDQLYNMDYREFADFHRKSGADFTVSVTPVNAKEATDLGILRLSSANRIAGFKEKPKTRSELKGFALTIKDAPVLRQTNGTTYLASMGVYIFKAKALLNALDSADADFGKEVIPHSIKKLKGYGFIFGGYWKDIGTIKSFYNVNIEMARHRPQFSFLYQGHVFTRPRFLPSARFSSCRIKTSLIAEGSIINDADISDSVIGLRSIVGRCCKISRTVVMGADYYEGRTAREANEAIKIGIGDRCRIDRAIVDKNARIGSDVIIQNFKNLNDFDGKDHYIRDGIVIIPKNAVLNSGTRI